MRIFLILLTVFSVSAATHAQTKKLKYDYDSCLFEGTYDAAKYSEKTLRNTLGLINYNDFWLDADATPRDMAGVKLLNVAALDAEYAEKSTRLKKLAIVKSAYFEAIRQKKLKELEQYHRLKKTTMLAHTNPAELRRYTGADSCVQTYADALANGGEDLLGVWRAVNEKARAQNIDPNRVKSIFDRRFAAPERYDYARIEVMTFGWWNCANGFVERVEYDGTERKQFEKFFKRVKEIECDEP